MNEPIKVLTVQEDAWTALRSFTAARIALGRTGTAIPLKESLAFRMAHAHARDAVYARLDIAPLAHNLETTFQLPVNILHSSAAGRQEYLQRPDLGRRLDATSVRQLQQMLQPPCDIAVILGDGLSATAVQAHAIPLLDHLVPFLKAASFTLSSFSIVQQARVGVSDEVASLLQARLSLILIGERPGLSAADSLGAYLTYGPRPGLTDESRNCVSNIRPEGLSYQGAALRIGNLITQALRLGLSGVGLKDNYLHHNTAAIDGAGTKDKAR